jgi:RNA-directed DNA polymerase
LVGHGIDQQRRLKIRGWLQYYGRYYRSALYPPMRQLDRSLARWAARKYKKLRDHLRRATHWVAYLATRSEVVAHWQMTAAPMPINAQYR